MKRRDFLKLSAIATAAITAPITLKAATNKQVVIIGGGFSGATCAKYLKLWGGSSIDVTLIDTNPIYTSPILSNLVLNNIKSIDNLKFTYDKLISYGVKVINKKAVKFDTTNKVVTLEDESLINYDKLVLAPGIDFKYTNNYDTTKVPHAWIAGEQTTILKNQIDTLKSGDTFIMSIPKSPYRCPPGPYERACVVADYLKDKGLNVNVILLDENPDIIVEKDSFGAKFNEYGIDYRPNSKVTYVDDTNMKVTYTQNNNSYTISGNVINIIPNQKAGEAAFLAGVVDEDFAPVDTKNYESLIKKDVHIIGDSHKSSQPKAGHIGNGEAKICADAILRELNGYALYQTPKTNSACYSPVSNTEATWLTAIYQYDPTTKDMKIMPGYPKSGAPSSKNFSDMFNWAGNLFSNTFA
ncbi:NAD(P)/FAD-dependent oxidoreductase [Caminibacter profundus]